MAIIGCANKAQPISEGGGGDTGISNARVQSVIFGETLGSPYFEIDSSF